MAGVVFAPPTASSIIGSRSRSNSSTSTTTGKEPSTTGAFRLAGPENGPFLAIIAQGKMGVGPLKVGAPFHPTGSKQAVQIWRAPVVSHAPQEHPFGTVLWTKMAGNVVGGGIGFGYCY